MANTTNFNWETPDDTDLVKDGALAIRTLGNSIDTTLVDLKGGTTGQVLSKTSNTDMDFTWVTSDDANAIQNAIVDAKGDLITATAADTPARLAVGNNGETLVADSSATTGLRWQGNYVAGKNFLINGAMDFWQRGTSFNNPASPYYTADRWQGVRAGAASGITISRQTTSDTTNLPFIQYAIRLQRDSGNTNTSDLVLCQSLESATSTPLFGKAITVSFYARRGANYSGASNNITSAVYSGTTTDGNLLIGPWANSVTVANTTATLTTTWQRFSYTGTVGSSVSQVGIEFRAPTSGTAGANDWVEITGVQLELGSVATTFTRAGGTLAGELAACQRYYCKSYSQGTSVPTNSTLLGAIQGNSTSTPNNGCYGFVRFPVVMRVAPTVTTYSYTSSTVSVISNAAGTDQTAASGNSAGIGDAGFGLYNNSGGTVTTTNGFIIHFAANAEL